MVTPQNILLAIPVLAPLPISDPDESSLFRPLDCLLNKNMLAAPIDGDDEEEDEDEPEEEEDDLDEEEEEDDEDDYEDDVIIEDDDDEEEEDELDDEEEEEEEDDDTEEEDGRVRRIMTVNNPHPSRHSQAVRRR